MGERERKYHKLTQVTETNLLQDTLTISVQTYSSLIYGMQRRCVEDAWKNAKSHGNLPSPSIRNSRDVCLALIVSQVLSRSSISTFGTSLAMM